MSKFRFPYLLILSVGFLVSSCTSHPQNPLNSTVQIRALSPDEAAHGHQVQITGECFYADHGDGISFLEDSTGGIPIDTTVVGALLERKEYTIQGKTYFDGQRVGVRAINKSEGKASAKDLPAPELSYDLNQGWNLSPELQYKTITVKGVIRSASNQTGKTIFHLGIGDGLIKVVVRSWSDIDKYALPTQAVGAQIQLKGVLSYLPATPDQPLELELFIPSSRHDIQLLKHAPRIQEIPKRSIGEILQSTNQLPYNDRVFVRGIVVKQMPGNWLILQDGTGTIEVRGDQMNTTQANREIEVVGFPQWRADKVILEHSIFKPLGQSPKPNLSNPLFVQSVLGDPNKVISTIRELQEMNPVEASLSIPIRLKGVITLNAPERWLMFLQDDTGGSYVRFSAEMKGLKQGDFIEVEGISDPCGYAPCINIKTFKLLGVRPLPNARPFKPENITTGKWDSELIEIEGTIRGMQLIENQQLILYLRIFHETYRLILTDRWEGKLPQQLLDTTIKMKVIWGVRFNGQRQAVRTQFLANSLETMSIIRPPASTNLYTLPTQPIHTLMQYQPLYGYERIRIQGTVIYQLPDGKFYLRDDNSSVFVSPIVGANLKQGAQVDVTGFPIMRDGAVIFEDATVQAISPGELPQPIHITAQQASQVNTDGQMVVMEAQYLGSFMLGKRLGYTLKSGTVTFNAYLMAGQDQGLLATMQPGSYVRLTGLNRVRYEEIRVWTWDEAIIQSFEILLPSANSVEVIKNPPWWTVEKALGLVVAFVLISALILVWVIILRRRVHQQTTVIRQKLESEAALELRFRNLFDNAQDLVYIHDDKGNIISFNRAAERVTGFTTEDLGQLNIMRFIPPESVEQVTAARREKKEVGDSTTYETEILTKDGRRIPVEVNSTLIATGQDSPTILGIARDITTRKQIEAELQSARDNALKSAQMKSEFLANMSHEIRTPMNGVIGMTGLLLETKLDDEQRDFAETVMHSAEALMTIINDILDFSKIEAGKLDLEKLDFILRETMEEAVELLVEKAEQKNLELTLHVHSDVPLAVHSDPGRIRQILLNLLGNALKFTEQGEVGVEISRQTNETGKEFLRFAVHDTGIGLSEETQVRLFTAFTQADSSTRRKYGGTGLGLSISKHLVEMMGGEIGVSSTLGVGSTFWFTIPLVSAMTIHSSKATIIKNLTGKRALIVDDNATSRYILASLIAEWGLIPSEAINGVEALKMLKQLQGASAQFDTILLDYHLPDMNGLEFIQHITAEPQLSDIPIILLTSFTRREQVKKAKQIGITAHCTKPVRQSHLLNALGKLLDSQLKPVIPIFSHDETDAPVTDDGPISAHLLIVEDNVVNQKLIRRQVEKLGYRADIVGNGAEAVEALSYINYDLILMDCQMPVLDGYEATKHIRKHEEPGLRVPILALTANALGDEQEKCLKVGMDDVMTKPISIELLQSKLTHWLEVSAESKYREELFAATVLRRNQSVSEESSIADQITESDSTQVVTS